MKRGLTPVLFAVAAVCLNVNDVKNAECEVACRREGAHAGYYVEKKDACACVNFYSYKKVTRKDPVRQRLENIPLNEPEPYVKPQKVGPWEE